jgi:5-methylthioadenosine/S-adenosylhomocysteine deaminase
VIPPRSQRHLLVRGGTVVTQDPDRRVLEADVLITEGTIVAVGPDIQLPSPTRLLEARGMVVIPGLIQAHVHLGHVLYRGRVWAADTPWQDAGLAALDLAHDDDTAYWSTLLGGVECLLSGTTTVADFGLPRGMEGVYRAHEASGIRALTGPMLDGASVSEALDAMQARHGRARGRLRAEIHVASPESPKDVWKEAVACARALNVRLHTHVSGGKDSPRETQQLRECGALEAGLTLAHGLLLEPSASGTGLGIVHCPKTEAKQGRREWPERLGLGCDGIAGTNGFDLFEELRLGAALREGGSVEDVFHAATRGGAEVLGLGAELGSLEPGKAGDLVVLDLGGAKGFAHPDAPLVSRIVGQAGRASVRWVVVDGEILVEDGRMPHLDLDALARKPDEAARALFARAGREGTRH